jgi:hypothetical protein
MLVQSVQEAIKNLLKLKTAVWERFIFRLYSKEFPSRGTSGIEPGSSDEKTKSYSFLQRMKFYWRRVISGPFTGEFGERLQRLREMVTKGDKVLRMFKTNLHEIAHLNPSAPDFSHEIFIKKVVELFDPLREIVGLRLDGLLGMYDRNFTDGTIKKFYEEIRDFESRCSNLSSRIKAIDISIIKTFQEVCNKLINSINEIEAKISDYRFQIENKMDAWLAQVNEEYKRNMLKWTIVISLLFVGIFNADSFKIYKHLAVDLKTQAAVIQKAAEMGVRVQKASGNDLNIIEHAIRDGKLDEARKEAIQFSAKLEGDFGSCGAKDKADGVKKIKSEVEGLDLKNISQAKESLKGKMGEMTELYVDLQKECVDYQLKGLTSLDLPLGWATDWSKLKTSLKEQKSWDDKLLILVKKIGGLLITAFLITFGAPFWNDILSALMGIKNVALSRK